MHFSFSLTLYSLSHGETADLMSNLMSCLYSRRAREW